MAREDGCAVSLQRNRGWWYWIQSSMLIYFYLLLLSIVILISYHVAKMVRGDLPCSNLSDILGSLSKSPETFHLGNLLHFMLETIDVYLILSLIGPISFIIVHKIYRREKGRGSHRRATEEKKDVEATEEKKDKWGLLGWKAPWLLFLVLLVLFTAFRLQFEEEEEFLTRYVLLIFLHFLVISTYYMLSKILSKYIEPLPTEKLLEDEFLKRAKDVWKEHGDEFAKALIILFYLYISFYYMLSKGEVLKSCRSYLPGFFMLISFVYIYVRFLNPFIETIANHLVYEIVYSKGYTSKKRDVLRNHIYRRYSKIVKDILGILVILLTISVIFTSVGESLLGLIKTLISNYAMSFALGIPFLIYLAILLIDPYTEGEIITFGEKIGKVVKLNPLFTEIITLENEKIYVPNALLLAKQFSRLSYRKPARFKTDIGFLTHFSATLGYNYESHRIEEKFSEVMKKIRNDEEKCENSELRKFIKERVLRYPGKRTKRIEEALVKDFEFGDDFLCFCPEPFVSIRDFKDHGIEYNFNFYVTKPFFLPLIKSYIMKKTFESFEKGEIRIMTPLQFEHAHRRENTQEKSQEFNGKKEDEQENESR